MKKIYLKRFEISAIFEKSNQHLATNDTEIKNSKSYPFIIIKRMHACIHARPESINFFFSHIYRVNTFKTKLYQKILIHSCKNKVLRKILIKTGLIDALYITSKSFSQKWKEVDVLFAEWDFIGIFFGKKKMITHLLYDNEYISKLESEIKARTDLQNIINIPKYYNFDNTGEIKWYQDELSVSKNGQFINDLDFISAQDQLIKVYKITEQKISLNSYLKLLQKRIKEIYLPNHPLFNQLQNLLVYIKEHSSSTDLILTLARSHGDFNKNQLLKKENDIYIIDWAESEQNIIMHDLVYNQLFNVSNSFSDNSKLKQYLNPFSKELTLNTLKAIVLIEVALKQATAYKKNRGTLKNWQKLFIELVELRIAS